MLPLDKLEPLVAELNNHPAWRDLVALMNKWVTTEALNALSPLADDFTRGRIAGVRQLVTDFDAARVSAQQRMRTAAEMREARRLDPLIVPGEYGLDSAHSPDSARPVETVTPVY